MHGDVFDICVIGAGMVGSAAAKYCSMKGLYTLLIGTAEPKKEDWDKTEIFGAYYDESRATRNMDANFCWGYWARESIKRYRHIEAESGVNFFNEVGYLICANSGHQFIVDNLKVTKELGTHAKLLETADVEKIFPSLNLLPNREFLFECDKAGTINPRKLVLAQQILARKYGCTVVVDRVIQTQKLTNETDEFLFKVLTEKSGVFHSKRIILCTGAFIEQNDLLMNGPKPDLCYWGASAICISVSHNQQTQIANLPSISFWSSETSAESVGFFAGLNFFLTPPVLYADGNYYMKVYTDPGKLEPINSSEVSEWYRCGSKHVNGEQIARIAKTFIPALEGSNFKVITCVITTTPTKMPYIDEVAPGVVIFAGCHGWAAKSSDELGRLCVEVATDGKWDCPFSQSLVKAKFKQ